MPHAAQTTRAPDVSQPSHTPRRPPRAKAKSHPPTPRGPCLWQAAEPLACGPLARLGGSPAASRPCGVSRAPASRPSGAAGARKRRAPARVGGRYPRSGRLAARSTCSALGGMRPSAGAQAAAVRAGRAWAPARPSGSALPSSSPQGPTRSGSRASSACRGPLQTDDSAWPGYAQARGGATLGRLTSVSAAANGTRGTNPRRLCWVRPCRGRPRTACASSTSAGLWRAPTSPSNRTGAWQTGGGRRTQRPQSGWPLSAALAGVCHGAASLPPRRHPGLRSPRWCVNTAMHTPGHDWRRPVRRRPQ
jgi:hypothetical protein